MKYLLEHESWKKESELDEFMQFCKEVLGYEQEPNIEFSDDLQKAQEIGSMGYFDPATNEIWVFKGRRVKADWYRTLAHELVHHAQREMGTSLDGSDGSDTENEANAKAGEILRAWGRKDPAIFESSVGEYFSKKLRLARLGLTELEDLSGQTWYVSKTWTKPDDRRMGMRLKISKLLSPEDIENLDSLKKDGVVWFTDSLPGSYQDYTDKHLKIVGPSSAVKDAVKLIDRMFDEALHRISDNPKADGLDVSGYGERVWHMKTPELNRSWGKEQRAAYALWKSKLGIDDPMD
jgi:hypothetical protein